MGSAENSLIPDLCFKPHGKRGGRKRDVEFDRFACLRL